MEESKKTGEIRNLTEEITICLCIVAELRPLLAEANLVFQHGLVIYAETQTEADTLVEEFQKTGAVEYRRLAQKNQHIRNNQIGLHRYGLYDREAEIVEFLESEGFLPVVLVHSIIPQFLEAAQNLLVYPQRNEGVTSTVGEEIGKIQSYIRRNPELIMNQINLHHTSTFFMERRAKTPLLRTLGVAVEVFCNYFRERHSESETEMRKVGLQEMLVRYKEMAEAYRGSCDVCDAVRRAVEEYVDVHTNVDIACIDQIEGPTVAAIQREEAILFDSESYYMPEKVLNAACESLSRLVSMPCIKRELRNSGVLVCNDLENTNFTSKKVITTVYGSKLRIRFLKIKKEFFEAIDSFGLEERRRQSRCFLEVLAEGTVR